MGDRQQCLYIDGSVHCKILPPVTVVCSILSISPELISLPGDPSASEVAFAGTGCDASSDAFAGGEHHAGDPDTLLAHGQR